MKSYLMHEKAEETDASYDVEGMSFYQEDAPGFRGKPIMQALVFQWKRDEEIHVRLSVDLKQIAVFEIYDHDQNVILSISPAELQKVI